MKKLLFICICILLGNSLVSAQTEFITTWKTDNPGFSADNQITIPTGTGTFSYTVDWGDSTTDTTIYTGSTTHTYSAPGTYTVTISGTSRTSILLIIATTKKYCPLSNGEPNNGPL